MSKTEPEQNRAYSKYKLIGDRRLGGNTELKISKEKDRTITVFSCLLGQV
jgi:hypothetical protein